MRARFLRQNERAFARKLFGASAPVDDILVTDQLGAGNQPCTHISAPSRGGFLFQVPFQRPIYALHMGAAGFENCLSLNVKAAFARQLGRATAYVRRGVSSRVDYDLSRPWYSFDADQRASVVEDWFATGMRSDDPRGQIIQNHILAL